MISILSYIQCDGAVFDLMMPFVKRATKFIGSESTAGISMKRAVQLSFRDLEMRSLFTSTYDGNSRSGGSIDEGESKGGVEYPSYNLTKASQKA